MKHLNFILIFFLFVTIISCDGETSFFTEEKVSIKDEFKTYLSTVNTAVIAGDSLLASKVILDYYTENNFELIWINDSTLNSKGEEMIGLIEHAYEYGLMPEFYHFETIKRTKQKSLLETEFLLSNALVLYVTHLNVGFLDTNTMAYSWKKDSVSFKFDEVLNLAQTSENITDLVTSHQPESWEYERLQKGLQAFVLKYQLDTNHFNIPKFKEDSVKCYSVAREALIAHYFLDSLSTDSVFIEKLKEFQIINGLSDDAIVGRWTGRMLAESNSDRFYKAMLSLEKWRWKKQNEFPKRYIRVNIPGYTLKLWDNNQMVRKHRVVVGAYATQTPEFHATLKRFITNPFWHLPYSIASTESLNGVKKDSNYFSKRGMKLFRDGAQVDPKTVDWNAVNSSNFRYRIRQDGGGSNSLGRVKFLFPNRHAVYFHDTPSKRLFKNDVRAYSHGCVRLHLPFDFAKTLLEVDEHKLMPAEFDTLIKNGIQRVVELNTPFEVFIEYYTASGDSTGTITFHPDVYNRDDRFLIGIKKEYPIEIK